ncbi:hypothetical protein [Desulfurivibrio alkaliphilus]|uniref:Uncharacterized protein n=1 Tax=Desulfurivibrio alkaliphilus (strain DSM 19089 / UNIQEM U267 / AHT2) TaxID=589865 RepID=D6Z389_DESAT|nr:hypothetical protein [Desulfurivibrio alkaliphilus]ADH86014.1 conserved hypothetical protein [Desulfurivibrio alkaliphilus AHT 2]
MPDANKRAAPRQSSRLPIILSILLLLAASALMLWYFALTPREPAVTFEPLLTEPATEPPPFSPEPTAPLPQPVPPSPLYLEVDEPDECKLVEGQIKDFFTHLDQQNYIRQRELPDGSLAYFHQLTQRLLAAPPTVSGETADIHTVLRNTAHLYRVLGLKDLWLLREVMQNERATLEELLALLYRWSLVAEECQDSDLEIRLPLPATYEYAGFFLNTLGGRAYLFRRDSRTRLLTTYYAVLILDQANEAAINRHGLDIRPAIDNLLAEIPGADNLRQREEYLATLIELQDKYRRQYGAGKM